MNKIVKISAILGATLVATASFVGCSLKHNIGDLPDESRFENLSYYKNGAFVSPQELPFYEEKIVGDSVWFGRSKNAPKKPLPMVNLSTSSFGEPSEFAYYWLGHSSAILELNGVRILIDPVFFNAAPLEWSFLVPRFQDAPIKRENLPKIDVVLITHDHYDHLETSTIEYLKDRVTRFITPLGVGARLKSWGVDESRIVELGWGDSAEFGGVKFGAEQTVHYSARWRDDRSKTLWVAYVLQGVGRKIYWGGDSGYGEHYKQAGEKYGGFDMAFLEIDAFNPGWPKTHMFPDEVVRAAGELGADVMLPIHWGVFNLGRQSWGLGIKEVDRLTQESGVKLHVPMMGERYNGVGYELKRWWEF